MINTIEKIMICEDIGEVEMTINEYSTKKEIVKLIQEWKDNIKFCERINQDPDMYIFVEYEDGTTYSRSFGEEYGKFHYTHVKAVMMDDGYEYHIFGKYEINENAIPHIA